MLVRARIFLFLTLSVSTYALAEHEYHVKNHGIVFVYDAGESVELSSGENLVIDRHLGSGAFFSAYVVRKNNQEQVARIPHGLTSSSMQWHELTWFHILKANSWLIGSDSIKSYVNPVLEIERLKYTGLPVIFVKLQLGPISNLKSWLIQQRAEVKIDMAIRLAYQLLMAQKFFNDNAWRQLDLSMDNILFDDQFNFYTSDFDFNREVPNVDWARGDTKKKVSNIVNSFLEYSANQQAYENLDIEYSTKFRLITGVVLRLRSFKRADLTGVLKELRPFAMNLDLPAVPVCELLVNGSTPKG